MTARSRRSLLSGRLRISATSDGCIATFLAQFGRRAFRRPLTEAEHARYLAMAAELAQPDAWEGVRLAVADVRGRNLLGLLERVPARRANPDRNPVADLELARRDDSRHAGPPEAELMRQNIPSSKLKVIRRAGHYSPWEQPGEAGQLLRQFLDSVYGA